MVMLMDIIIFISISSMAKNMTTYKLERGKNRNERFSFIYVFLALALAFVP